MMYVKCRYCVHFFYNCERNTAICDLDLFPRDILSVCLEFEAKEEGGEP